MADTPFDVQGDDILIRKTINCNYPVDKMHLPRHYIASNGGKLAVNGGIREGGGGRGRVLLIFKYFTPPKQGRCH